MKVTVQVIIESDEDALPIVEQIACVEREALTAETLGLTLHEAKTIVAQLQATLVTRQAAAYVTQHQRCPRCGVRQRCKGHHQIVLRSLFGKLTVPSPRLYTCRCQAGSVPGSWSPLAERLSERTTPERRYLEAKWAALLPYGVTVDLLEEVLPLQTNPASVYRHVQQVAERLEGELAAVPTQGITGDGDDRSRPGGPVKVGLDGGYVHARDGTNRKAGWFEMIVGVSTPSDSATKRFGFVSGYDTHAKRRLCRVLNAQGMELHQAITFLSDGGDTVRDLPLALSPVAEHVLDWFHIVRQEVAYVIVRQGQHDDRTWCPITSTLGGEAGR